MTLSMQLALLMRFPGSVISCSVFPPLSGEMGAQHSGCTDDTSVTATVEELMDNASIY